VAGEEKAGIESGLLKGGTGSEYTSRRSKKEKQAQSEVGRREKDRSWDRDEVG